MSDTPRNRLALFAVVAVTLGLVLALNPGLVRFWPFSAGEFVQLIAPLFLVALFIERTLEVFLTSWRGAAAAQKELAVKQAEALVEANVREGQDVLAQRESDLTDYKTTTQRYAFGGGLVLGILVSAVGIRALQLFVDPAVFATLSSAQRSVFTAADVLLTGAVIGGGAEGMHKLVSVFTNFMDSTAKLAKARGEP